MGLPGQRAGRLSDHLHFNVAAFGFELAADEIDIAVGQGLVARTREHVRKGLGIGKANGTEFTLHNTVARYGDHCGHWIGIAGHCLEPFGE